MWEIPHMGFTRRIVENLIITKMSPNYYHQTLRNYKGTKNSLGQT